MAFVSPLPPIKVYVKAEYLYDQTSGHGELLKVKRSGLKLICLGTPHFMTNYLYPRFCKLKLKSLGRFYL